MSTDNHKATMETQPTENTAPSPAIEKLIRKCFPAFIVDKPRSRTRFYFHCLHFLEVRAAVEAAYEAGKSNPGRTSVKQLRLIIEDVAKKHLFPADADGSCKRGMRYCASIYEVEVRGPLEKAFRAGKAAAKGGQP